MVQAFFRSFEQLLITLPLMGMGIHGTDGFVRNLLKATALLITMLLCATLYGNVDPQPSTDCVVCDGSAVVTTTLPGEVSYQWFNNNGTLLSIQNNDLGSATLNNLCPGLYQVQLTNGTGNELYWFSVGGNGIEPGTPTTISVCTNTGQYNLNNQIADLTAGGAWTDPAGQPHSGTFISASQNGGLYTYTVDAGGCTLTTGVFVDLIQNADPGLSATYLICETYDPFFLTDVLAGTPDPGGQWYNSEQVPIDGFYYPDTDETSLFIYELNTVDGCPAVFSTLFVIENQLPDPGLDTEIQVCPNAIAFDMTAQLNGTPETNGLWYDEENDVVGPQFDPTTMGEGVYNYVVPGQTPCPSQESFMTIEFTAGISAGEPADVAVCENTGTVNLFTSLNGAPTEGGVWSAPDGSEANITLDLATAQSGVYTYQVDAVGCQPEESTVNLTIEALPEAGQGGLLTVCEDSSPIDPYSLLTDADLDGSFSLDGNEIIGALNVEGGESYVLDYLVEGALCPNDAAIYTIQTDQLPQLLPLGEAELCSTQGTVQLNDYITATNGDQLTWSAPGGAPEDGILDPAVDPEGGYTATLTSGNSCPDAVIALNVTIDEPAFPNGAMAIDDCVSGQVYDLNDLLPPFVPEGGQWSFNGQEVNTVIDANSVASGDYSYMMESMGACGTSTFSVQLDLTDPLEAGEGNTLEVCSSDPVVDLAGFLNGASDGGAWLFNDTPIASATFDPATDQPGVYSYTVPAQGPCPSDTADFTIEVQEGIVYTAGPDIEVCDDETVVTLGESECADCAFAWTGDAELSSTDAPFVDFALPEVDATSEFNFQVVVSSGVCSVQDEVVVTVNPTPQITLDGPGLLCAGEQGTWTANGAAAYEWSTNGVGSGSGAQLNTEFFENTTLSVLGTTTAGCTGESAVEIVILPLPDLSVSVEPQSACAPLQLQLPDVFPDADATYWWEINGTVVDAGVTSYELNTPGTYEVILNAAAGNGCLSSNSFTEIAEVYGYPWPAFSFDATTFSVLEPEVAFTNESQDAVEYSWDFGGQGTSFEVNPSFTFPAIEGQGYNVCLDATNEDGCTATQCETLFINDELLVYVPNAFTPDNDGLNDVFYPVLRGFSPAEYTFSVFNRWGERIFSSDTPGEWWNGSVNGGAYYAQNGVYVWVVEVRATISAQKRRMEGHVTLLR
jgi:gliding motility-associated-like protein